MSTYGMATRTRSFNCCAARSFRRWKNKEISAFDCEPTKDTPESAPIRHPDQVLGLLEQVIRDREFARKTIVQHESELFLVLENTKILKYHR
jgi:hypothetical protein